VKSPLYDVGRQLIQVRGLMFVSIVFGATMLWSSIESAQTYGLRPADGGVLAPLAVRLALGIGTSLLSISFPVAMWLYFTCYVSKVEFDQQTKILTIYTLRFFGSGKAEIEASRLLSSKYLEGKHRFGVKVNDGAGWIVKVKGRKLPLIIDEHGKFMQKGLMDKLFHL
jgi:TMEM70/TMEM186/TMEM223 protein family